MSQEVKSAEAKNAQAGHPLPGSEGLRPFSWSGVNKFDLQTANDLFEKYATEKDPRTLGEINALKLDVMKRAAEAEIAKLTPPRTRAEIEAEMARNQVSKAQANDELAYVLVTYLKNAEKLFADRAADVAAVEKKVADDVAALKAEVKAAKKSDKKDAAPKGAEAKEAELDADERKSAEFIKQHRAEIDALVAKLPAGKAKETFPSLLNRPTKANVILLQAEIGLKGNGDRGSDGRFGKFTLATLRKYAENGGKKTEGEETGRKKESKTPEAGTDRSVKPKEGEKKAPKKSDKAAEEKKRQAEEKRAEEEKRAAEEVQKKKEAEELAHKEKEISALQSKTLANLKPIGTDVFVVNTKFLKDRFAAAAFFKFDAKNGEWLWNSFNNPEEGHGKWHKVANLENSTVNEKTEMGTFGFVKSAQETVNAILEAQKKSREYGIRLKSPSAPAPITEAKTA